MFEILKRWFKDELAELPRMPLRRGQEPSVSLREYPSTYQRSVQDEPAEERRDVFDPALRHFIHGVRRSDPTFEKIADQQAWLSTRAGVVAHLLSLIQSSCWREHLVLRGSLLLKAWIGADAREPGDIDWVFQPKAVGTSDFQAKSLFYGPDGLIAMVKRNARGGGAEMDVANISVDDIWTYERAAGRRIVFPWKRDGLPCGQVQMDVTFQEDLFTPPAETEIATAEAGPVNLWAASREVSLAWKLLWLTTDSYPQGKDLYDATLLAERVFLPRALLERVLKSAAYPAVWRSPLDWECVDWENFKLEYPQVQGTEVEWRTRLDRALAPTFADQDLL